MSGLRGCCAVCPSKVAGRPLLLQRLLFFYLAKLVDVGEPNQAKRMMSIGGACRRLRINTTMKKKEKKKKRRKKKKHSFHQPTGARLLFCFRTHTLSSHPVSSPYLGLYTIYLPFPHLFPFPFPLSISISILTQSQLSAIQIPFLVSWPAPHLLSAPPSPRFLRRQLNTYFSTRAGTSTSTSIHVRPSVNLKVQDPAKSVLHYIGSLHLISSLYIFSFSFYFYPSLSVINLPRTSYAATPRLFLFFFSSPIVTPIDDYFLVVSQLLCFAL